MKIGMIGAGKAGFTFGKYLREHGETVTGYYSKRLESAKEAAEFTGTKYFEQIEQLVEESDQLFLTVPDREIEAVWNRIKLMPIKNKIICHCSGSFSSAIFSGIDQCFAFGYSIHPLFAIRDKRTSYKELSNAFFTIEGHQQYLADIVKVIRSFGNTAEVIAAKQKIRYHAAAVMLSNQVTALAFQGEQLFSECGFTPEFAEKAWNTLFLENAKNICQYGIVNSLTGPVERGDAETLKKHLEYLTGDSRQLYLQLSQILVKAAKKKNPERDYQEVEKELRKYEKHSGYL